MRNRTASASFGPIISAYTRQQAISDGILVDVTTTAKEAGFSIPVALTRTVWTRLVALPEGYRGFQDESGRLWDVLHMARHYALAASGRGRVRMCVLSAQSARICATACTRPASTSRSSRSTPATPASPSSPSCFPTTTERPPNAPSAHLIRRPAQCRPSPPSSSSRSPRRVAETLNDPKRWHQGGWGRDDDGYVFSFDGHFHVDDQNGNPHKPALGIRTPDAPRCFCLGAAIRIHTGDISGLNPSSLGDLVEQICLVYVNVGKLHRHVQHENTFEPYLEALIAWNDQPSRTFREIHSLAQGVVAHLDAARFRPA